MVGLNFQRSPRSKCQNLPPQAVPASRLHRSASVPKLTAVLTPPQPQKNALASLRSSQRSTRLQHDAPYPLSYESSSLGCDALDNLALKNLQKSCTWQNFAPEATPTCCLDLGCGTGAWVLHAAGEWPECEFIGLDLVNIQPPPSCLDPKSANRIKWVRGNFLKQLPFEDGYFDHVHIRHIARGVPEDKWHHIMAEVARVLKDGGTVELFEEDIIFPVLPRSSTATPRQRARKRSTILRPSASVTKQHAPASLPPHDHALLETLFYRVFARRFVNLHPTKLILGVLNVHMRGASGSPLINFPLPPAPVLADSRAPTPMPAPVSVKVKEEDEDTLVDVEETSTVGGRGSSDEGSTPATSVTDFQDTDADADSHSRAAFLSETEGSERMLLSEGRLSVTEGTLGLHLYRSWQGVMSCREAMWEEYCDMVQRGEALLAQVDWEEEELGWTDRRRFEALLARYKADMEGRYPISDALVSDLHWPKPQIEVTKEGEGERKEVAAARSDALRLERSGIGAVPEASKVCRKARVFVASKGRVYRG